VALTYRATVDVPARFKNSKAVGAVFGLTPSRHQSGESDRPGAISRCGDEMMREEMVMAQGLGNADRQALWDEKGDRRAGPPVGRDHAPDVG